MHPLNDPNNPLNATTWMRGAYLGMLLVFLFAMGAALTYLVGSLLGWSGAGLILLAMLVGPFLGTVAAYALWVIKKPTLSTIQPPSPEKREAQRRFNPNSSSEAKTNLEADPPSPDKRFNPYGHNEAQTALDPPQPDRRHDPQDHHLARTNLEPDHTAQDND